MLELFQGYFLEYGYYFLFLGSVLEGVIFTGFFVPGGLLVLLGGYFARTNPGEVNFLVVVFLSWIGMFLGDLVNYFFGKSIWERYFARVKLFQRLANVHFFGEEKRIAAMLEKWGLWAIFYSHVVGALRSVIGFVAGASGYPLRRYIWSTLIASLLWSLIFSGVGYYVAEAIADFDKLNTTITFSAIGVLLLVLFIRFVASLTITFFTSRYVVMRLRRLWIVQKVVESKGVFEVARSIWSFLRQK